MFCKFGKGSEVSTLAEFENPDGGMVPKASLDTEQLVSNVAALCLRFEVCEFHVWAQFSEGSVRSTILFRY